MTPTLPAFNSTVPLLVEYALEERIFTTGYKRLYLVNLVNCVKGVKKFVLDTAAVRTAFGGNKLK